MKFACIDAAASVLVVEAEGRDVLVQCTASVDHLAVFWQLKRAITTELPENLGRKDGTLLQI